MTYAFGIKLGPSRIRLQDKVSVGELVHALNGTGLMLSNGIDGQLVIHRMPLGQGLRAPAGPVGTPPGPQVAA